MELEKEEWVLGREAASILTELSGHTITNDYIRHMAYKNRIRFRKRDKSTNEYYRPDVEGHRIKVKGAVINEVAIERIRNEKRQKYTMGNL